MARQNIGPWAKFLIIIVGFIAILYVIGIVFSTRCIQYEECKACWNITNDEEKNNAVVNLIATCLCPKAISEGYSDPTLNNIIEGNYKAITNISASVRDICEGQVPLILYNLTEE